MDKQSIIEKINGFLSEEFEIELSSITPEGNLAETLDLDSLDYIDLVVAIENNFGFKVKPEDFTSIKTFQDLYEYIFNRIDSSKVNA